MRKIRKCIIRARISAVQRISDRFNSNTPAKDKTLSKVLKMLEKIPPLRIKRILLKEVLNQHTDRQLMVNKELILKHLPSLCQKGIQCPNCGKYFDFGPRSTMRVSTTPEFDDESMSYNWLELHRCNTCHEIYVISNGT